MPPTTAPLIQPFASAGALAITIVSASVAMPRNALIFVPTPLSAVLNPQLRLRSSGDKWGAPLVVSTILPGRERLRPDFRNRHRRRDRFAVDGEADDRGLAGGLRLLESFGEILGAFDRDAEAAEGAGVSWEIRIAQLGCRDAAGIFALLMHADGAVHAVVGDDGDERRAVLHRRGKLLAVHQKIAVTGEAHHR